MESTKKIIAIIIGISFIIGMLLAANAYKYKTKKQQTIMVTGLAEHDFMSDLIVWEGSFNRQSFEMKEAYAAIKNDQDKVKAYLTSKGVNNNEISFSAITINKDFISSRDENGNYTQLFNGYNLVSNVTVESKDINKVENVSKDIAQLIDQGIEINSYDPRYYYTKLKDLKIDLLAKASEDARTRATTIAKNSKASLGKLINASMGIFQITGQNSDEDYSYGGTFNTSSKLKTASVTVRTEYQIK